MAEGWLTRAWSGQPRRATRWTPPYAERGLPLKRKPLSGCRKPSLPSFSSGKQQLPRTTQLRLGEPSSGLVGGEFVLAVAKEASICVGPGTSAPACHQDQ